jgi:hypothetical protein
MSCLEMEENLPLLLYAELSEPERAACEAHLEACAKCRALRAKTEQLHRVLAAGPRREPTASLLAESRQALEEALDREQHGWRAVFRNWPPVLRLQPASSFALGLTLMLCGFGIGWSLRPHAGRLLAGPAGVERAGLVNPDMENMRISDISRVAPDPKTGGVRITLDAERRVTLEGSFDNPKIRQVLVYAVKSYDNPGIRRDTLDALRSHANDPNIRQALLYALRHDPNLGVRLEALEAVRGMEGEEGSRALLDALEHDTNPGVRVAAVDALIDQGERGGQDASIQRALGQLATTDRNPYVRLKCANAMMKLGK